jgi:hypothetical protein
MILLYTLILKNNNPFELTQYKASIRMSILR